jgi:hypothetical protein
VPHHPGSAVPETTRPVNGHSHPLGERPVRPDRSATQDHHAATALWPF